MSIVELVSQYRKLKAERDQLDVLMVSLKDELLPLVTRDGDWQDAEGYVRLTTVKSSSSLDGKAALALMVAWSSSEDPIMRSCSDMLRQHLVHKDGHSYLSVK